MNFVDWLKKIYKDSKLLVLVVASMLAITVVSFFVAVIKGQYKPSLEHPPVEVLFSGSSQELDEPDINFPDIPDDTSAPAETSAPATTAPGTNAPVTEAPGTEAPKTDAPADPNVTQSPEPTQGGEASATPGTTPEATPTVEATPTQAAVPNTGNVDNVHFTSIPVVTPRCNLYESTGKKALTSPYDWQKVEKDYFKDTVFIGDSRIEGVALFSKLPADVIYARGMTIYGLMEAAATTKQGVKTTVTKEFQKKQYKVVYIMVGLNDTLGFTTKNYAAKYKGALDRIRQLQPNAKICILSTLYVTKKYSDAHKDINNDNINDKNQAVAQFCDDQNIFYLDINTVTEDNGALLPKHTEDGMHLFAGSMYLWDSFLMEHGFKS